MGTEASAEVIYGLPFSGNKPGDSEFEFQLQEDDEDTWLATHQGLVLPDIDDTEARKKYWELRKELPLGFAFAGDCGFNTMYLVIKEATISGDWRRGTPIPIGHVTWPHPKWNDLLREFCKKAGIPWTEPYWQMIVNYV